MGPLLYSSHYGDFKMRGKRIDNFKRGIRVGIPIGLGYFAVSIALGIAARNAGFTPLQATVTSLLINASAGEYAGFSLVASGAGVLEVAVMELIANARYLLMSCSLSQKLSQSTPLKHRIGVGFYITDEIFGVSMAYPGDLDPFFTYGAAAVASPCWGLGTLCGALLGSVLPLRVVSALSVGLYGMFLAIIIPPARRDRVIAGLVAVSFAASFAVSSLPLFQHISSGIKTIVLTVAISLAAAMFFPVKEAEEDE